MSAPAYLLTKQTFVALSDDTLVFLDLHRDKYSCLERRHTKSVCHLLDLPPEEKDGGDEAPAYEDNTQVAQVIQDLIDNGLVTPDPNEGKRAEFVTQHSELNEMPSYFPGEGPQVRIGDVVKFFKALLVTKLLLKFASMERIVTRVRRRKGRFNAQSGETPDEERLNELVETYKILKPMFVTVKGQCLFSSLFLIEFLACYRVYPNWYFGVRLNEFYAHCWVQDRNIIYDDFIKNTSANQPIMIV